MAHLGTINSRMKDFYDIWLLATRFAFDGAVLGRAIQQEFRPRGTPLLPSPVALSEAFAHAVEDESQWEASRRRLHQDHMTPWSR